MAWIKMKTSTGVELSVPESVYKNLYASNEAFTLVQESKPAPNPNEEEKVEKKEIVKDEPISRPKSNENNSDKKGSKKVN